jgi:hypothetical protein
LLLRLLLGLLGVEVFEELGVGGGMLGLGFDHEGLVAVDPLR